MKNNIKTIGIDARFYGPLGKGLGRYAQEVVDGVLELDQTNNYVIFLAPGNFADFQIPNQRVKKVLIKQRWYSLAEQLYFPLAIWRENIDLMHFLHFNVPVFCPTKFLVTIHDLILINHPTTRATTLGPIKYWLKNKGYHFVIWWAVHMAKQVIAVSEFTKDDIIKHFKIQPAKIVVSYEGVAKLNKNNTDDPLAVLQKFGIKKPYLLYIGNAYPHKNLEGLLEVFSEIHPDKTDLQLVLVGREDYFYKQIKDIAKKLNLSERDDGQNSVIFTNFVSDQEMATIYKNGLLYIFASFYEGFGLPPLEAMASGLPVLSSNRASMPEILGQAAAYFDPGDKKQFKLKILELIADKKMQESLVKLGYQQVAKYSWADCAKQTLTLYNKIVSEKLPSTPN
ncbi:MAG: glycosyltransferase family 1 protein [bacterium]